MKLKSLLSMSKMAILPAFALTATSGLAKVEKRPNIVYILADDLGYGDPSCYGQLKINTPNIDRLAKQGMRFTQHYSGSAVSAPSRSTLMTGLHTGHTPIRDNERIKGQDEGQNPIPQGTLTIAEMLKSAGYSTGAFGKWGLGYVGSEGDPTNKGFDTFFGYNCQTVAHRYYPPYLWHNDKKVPLEGNDWTKTTTYSADVIHEEALKFIESNKEKPFFLYYPTTLPHAELIAPEDEILEEQKKKFAGETPYVNTNKGADYGKDLVIKQYCSQPHPYATFASMIIRLDQHVGEILSKLQELGLEDNTIIMFASDNGPHQQGGANPEYFNSAGGLKGFKGDLFEGGIRCPMIVQWKGQINPNTTTDHISAFWDVMPTLADIVGAKPASDCDGISFLPTLKGKKQKEHKFLYWEFRPKGGLQAVRMGKWKAIREKMSSNPNAEIKLFDLSVDPTETTNVASANPKIVAQIDKFMKDSHKENNIFKFNYEKKD
ncbi:MAG: arylsulfatase [Bacteroidales bacterium]